CRRSRGGGTLRAVAGAGEGDEVVYRHATALAAHVEQVLPVVAVALHGAQHVEEGRAHHAGCGRNRRVVGGSPDEARRRRRDGDGPERVEGDRERGGRGGDRRRGGCSGGHAAPPSTRAHSPGTAWAACAGGSPSGSSPSPAPAIAMAARRD